jgi:hypothetical protein
VVIGIEHRIGEFAGHLSASWKSLVVVVVMTLPRLDQRKHHHC